MESQKLKYINKGYMNCLSSEMEIVNALSTKYKEFAEKYPDSKWQGISEGFELGLEERLQERKQELSKTKSRGKGKSQGRSR